MAIVQLGTMARTMIIIVYVTQTLKSAIPTMTRNTTKAFSTGHVVNYSRHRLDHFNGTVFACFNNVKLYQHLQNIDEV